MSQLDFLDSHFAAEASEKQKLAAAAAEQSAIANQISSWSACWGWDGPTVGSFCEVDSCVVDTEAGGSIYAYMEYCVLLEQRSEHVWLAEIRMPDQDGKPWPKNGTRLLLHVCDIWPPTRDLRSD